MTKYDDPGNPTVTVQIGHTHIPNILVDLGVAINVITIETVRKLGITNLRLTPTILELVDRSTIKLALEEISTQNGPFNFYSNSMSSRVSQ